MSCPRSLKSLALTIAICTQLAISQSQNQPASAKTTPPGVSVELATVDGRTTYHMGEEISLVTRYRSTVADRYLLETAICGKFTATADVFNRKPGKTQPIGSPVCYHAIYLRKGWQGASEKPVLAVDSNRVKLGSEPVELWSPGYLNYSQLGEHTVNITSRRVCPLDAPPVTETTVPESPFELTSNTLHIMIVPADNEWQHGVLAEIKPALRDRSRKDVPSCHWLRELSSREATLERLYQVRTGGPCLERAWFHTPLDFEELHKLFRDPKFPVTTNVLDQLAYGFVVTEHPELVDWDNSDLSFQEYRALFGLSFEKGRRHYTDELLALLPGKSRVAFGLSSQTAHAMDRALRASDPKPAR
jgi:hypothetical protein